MSNEYIERDCLIDMIAERNRNTCNGKMSCIQMKRMVESVPAADVDPVRHGHWYDKGSLSCRCSECGCKSNRENNYCPHCGAKMDLEGQEMTNADMIRSMSNEELAEVFCNADWCNACGQLKQDGTCLAMEMGGPLNPYCKAGCLTWLRQPAGEATR